MPEHIEQLLAFILSLSLVTERIVAFVKQSVPRLDEPANAVDVAKPEGEERIRRLSVQTVALAASSISLWLMEPSLHIDVGGHTYPFWFLAILGSGGSSFWSQMLGLTRAARDLKRAATVQTVNEELTRALRPPTDVSITHGKFVSGVARD